MLIMAIVISTVLYIPSHPEMSNSNPSTHLYYNTIVLCPLGCFTWPMSNTKTLSFWCLVMMVTKKLEDVHKNWFWAENSVFGAKNGHFGQSGPRNGPPSGQTATYRKTKVIQSYLRIWGTYDPIESGSSDPKKWGLYGCSVKKCRFWDQFWPKKGPLHPPKSLPSIMINTKTLSFWCPVMMATNKLEYVRKNLILGPKTAVLGPKRVISGKRGHETARRAAKQAPTGKPNVSRVTSWYWGLMVPLSRIRLTPKNGGYMGVA